MPLAKEEAAPQNTGNFLCLTHNWQQLRNHFSLSLRQHSTFSYNTERERDRGTQN